MQRNNNIFIIITYSKWTLKWNEHETITRLFVSLPLRRVGLHK